MEMTKTFDNFELGKDRDGIHRDEGDIRLEEYCLMASILPCINFTLSSFLFPNFITAFVRKKSVYVLMWTCCGSRY
jgi:hypothetical protein